MLLSLTGLFFKLIHSCPSALESILDISTSMKSPGISGRKKQEPCRHSTVSLAAIRCRHSLEKGKSLHGLHGNTSLQSQKLLHLSRRIRLLLWKLTASALNFLKALLLSFTTKKATSAVLIKSARKCFARETDLT